MWAQLAREWGVPGWFRMRYAYAETTPVLNLAAPSQIRGGWPEVGTTAAESARLPHTHKAIASGTPPIRKAKAKQKQSEGKAKAKQRQNKSKAKVKHKRNDETLARRRQSKNNTKAKRRQSKTKAL